MRLSHQLLWIAATVPLAFLLAWIEGLAGVSLPFETRMWIAMPFALVLGLFAAWPLARLFGVPPLMILSGPCPSCTQRPPGWFVEDPTRDPLQMACGLCRERVELWLVKTPGPSTGGARRFVLREPKFLGRWRRID